MPWGVFVVRKAFAVPSVFLFAFLFASAALAETDNCADVIAEKKYVLVVDAYSSGNLLPAALRARGYEPIHLLSSPDIPKDILASYRPEDFDKALRFHFKDLLQIEHEVLAIKRHIHFVIPGSETGVPLADFLSERWGLLSNGTELSEARRNKYLMAERLRSLGINAVKQFVSNNLDQILEDAPKLGKRVVVKPVKSAGSDDVFFCDTPKQIRAAFKKIMGKRNAYGIPNDMVLVQEYLDGPEYLVDTVVLDGQLQFTDAGYYTKTEANGSSAVYVGTTFVPYQELVDLGIVEYLNAVHRALGIVSGPGHAEVKIVEREGKKVPILVEIGSRLAGGGIPVLIAAANGKSQLDHWLDMLFEPREFAKNVGRPYRWRAAEMVCLIARKSGELVSYPYLERIEKLPSFLRFRVRVNPGDHLPLTTSFLDVPGHFELVHDDPKQVARDAEKIRVWEQEPDFYKLAGE